MDTPAIDAVLACAGNREPTNEETLAALIEAKNLLTNFFASIDQIALAAHIIATRTPVAPPPFTMND